MHDLPKSSCRPFSINRIRIASAEGLILLKLLAFRGQDQVDIENLIAAHRDTLDVDWIRAEWQTVTTLDDPRMQRFMTWVAPTRP